MVAASLLGLAVFADTVIACTPYSSGDGIHEAVVNRHIMAGTSKAHYATTLRGEKTCEQQ
jgi:hypothetical protein